MVNRMASWTHRWAPAWEKHFFQICMPQKRGATVKERKFRNRFLDGQAKLQDGPDGEIEASCEKE